MVGIVLPGTGSHSPCFQSRTRPWTADMASGVSCHNGFATTSVRVPRWSTAISEKRLAISSGRRSCGARFALTALLVPSRCLRKYSLPLAEDPKRLDRHSKSTRGKLSGFSGSSIANCRLPSSLAATLDEHRPLRPGDDVGPAVGRADEGSRETSTSRSPRASRVPRISPRWIPQAISGWALARSMKGSPRGRSGRYVRCPGSGRRGCGPRPAGCRRGAQRSSEPAATRYRFVGRPAPAGVTGLRPGG